MLISKGDKLIRAFLALLYSWELHLHIAIAKSILDNGNSKLFAVQFPPNNYSHNLSYGNERI